MTRKPCLIVVDYQNDFIIGSLALKNTPAAQDAAKLLPVINRLIEKFEIVFYTYDWHPPEHISFYENRFLHKVHPTFLKSLKELKCGDEVIFASQTGEPIPQVLWPAHCIQGTTGAELFAGTIIKKGAIHIRKGTKRDIDSYSGFWDNSLQQNQRTLNKANLPESELATALSKKAITDVYVCGIALDFCVGATAKHAAQLGFETFVIEDATCGVTHEGISETLRNLQQSYGCKIVRSEAVLNSQ